MSMNPFDHNNNKRPDKEPKDLLTHVEYAERRRQERILLSTTHLPLNRSLGERLVPYLYTALEACWVGTIIIALAGFDLFETHDAFMPLWAPFVIIAGALWFSQHLELRDARQTPQESELDHVGGITPGTGLLISLLTLAVLCLSWISIYASTYPFYNLTWLLALVNDILLFHQAHVYQFLAILAATIYFALRGVQLSRRVFEPGTITSVLRVGTIIILLVILIHAAQGSKASNPILEVSLFTLAPLFFFLALFAHSLTQATFVRHSHPNGLEGSTASQERSIFLLMGGIGSLLLILTLIVASLASPSFLTDLQGALVPLAALYSWLVDIFARLIVLLVTPIIWLLEAVHFTTPAIRLVRPPGRQSNGRPPTAIPSQAQFLAQFLAIAAPLALAILLGVLITRALRRRRVRTYVRQNDEEVHESLWSWGLFWSQIKLLILGLLARLFPRSRAKSDAKRLSAEEVGTPQARSIREVYRALLHKASLRGTARKRNETPFEFRRRLATRTHMPEPQLDTITEAYTVVRYGEVEPNDADVELVRAAWTELDRSWETSPH